MATFGENLRRVRRKKGLSMERLAVKADMAYKTVAYYEGGDHLPTTYNLIKLCRALGVPPQTLVEDFMDQTRSDDSYPGGVKP